MTTLATTPTSSVSSIQSTDAAVDFSKVNVFDHLAFLIRVVRLSLEGRSHSSPQPRYVRIARINSITPPSGSIAEGATEGIKTVVKAISNGTVYAVHRLIDLTLDAKDILNATDSLVAQLEVMLKLMQQIIEEDLPGKLVNSLTMGGLAGNTAFDGLRIIPNDPIISENFDAMKNLLDIIPDGDDLDLLGHELYRLACVMYDNNQVPSIDLEHTGKIRLMQFGFDSSWRVSYYNKEIKHLGKRLPPSTSASAGIKINDPSSQIPLFAVDIPTTETDLKEAEDLLMGLGYLNTEIKAFQNVNGLDVSGKFDNGTINRLFNLDIRIQNIVRAKKKTGPGPDIISIDDLGYLKIINHDAGDPKKDGVEIVEADYRYYIIKPTTNENDAPVLVDRGWFAVNTEKYIPGFVALESRKVKSLIPGKIYDGGEFSEGEASNGRFFFSARHTEPWKPGRKNAPQKSIYVDDKVGLNSQRISRMIQIVRVPGDVVSKVSSAGIRFSVSALVRSLYNDKSITDGKRMPDQGRIGLMAIIGTKDAASGGITYLSLSELTSEWFPDTSDLSDAILNNRAIDYRNAWMLQTSPDIVIEKAKLAGNVELYIKVILEGKHRASWDIDAYFDEVSVKWQYLA